MRIGTGSALACAFAGDGDFFAGEFAARAFKIRGVAAGSIVSLITLAGDFANVTGMFRYTSKFTVTSSCFESSE